MRGHDGKPPGGTLQSSVLCAVKTDAGVGVETLLGCLSGLTPGPVSALLLPSSLSPVPFLRPDAGKPNPTDQPSGDGANGARQRAKATFKAKPVS